MSAPLLELDRVSIRHDGGGRATPDGVSLSIAPGEVVLLLGPSGCGKSTLALALNGLIPHDVPAVLEGRVALAGLDTAVTPIGRLSEHAAMVFQDPDAQIVTGTLLDEVAFAPENQLVEASEVLACAERALRQVGLWERRTDNPDRLSGGGRQRLAIACALAMQTPLLVLDEPTANLDPAGIEEVYAVLRALAAEGGHAIVLVEHNLDAAIDLVDRVVVLDAAGRLVIDGDARQVLRERAEELLALGVWLPVSTLAALRLRGAGIVLEPLPLTPRELTAALDALPTLPEPLPADPGDRVVVDAGGRVSRTTSRDPGLDTRRASHAAARPPEEESTPHAAARPPEEESTPHAAARPPEEESTPHAAARPREEEPAVSVRGLSLRRGGKRGPVVVHDVSLEVAKGDFLAIVGTNGAGKTTLLQAIAGVIPPPRGTVRTDGLDPARTDPRELARHVGFVFQNPEHQFITHSVADELDHGLRTQGVPEDERADRVDEMLRRFGLETHREQHPFLLSGGQKRRLSVGTALIAGAPVLALDEPTFGQDRERAAELLDMLRSLNRDGTTIVVVTHDLQLVADSATHVAVMSRGRLLGAGPTAEVLVGGLIEEGGLRHPPLAQATRVLQRHPTWRSVARLAQLPSGPVVPVADVEPEAVA